MAEASPENTTLDTRTRINLVERLVQLIQDNSLDEIKQIFETLQPEQCINILNSSIHGFTPLYIAINLENAEISRYLLDLSLLQGLHEMTEHWKRYRHPLIAALIGNSQQLVELILRYLPDINENISGPLSPLMLAISLGSLTCVELIVARGADINRLGFHGISPLMQSIPKSDILRFLVGRRVNGNHQDDEGLTALHLTVTRQYTESLLHLLNVGADVRIRNHEGFTPLIWAIINLKIPEVIYLIQHNAYSVLDKIEAYEILNACYICAEHSNIEQWVDAIVMRSREYLPKYCLIPAQEILDFSQEFTSLAELEELQGNPLRLAYQSILVTERILGRNNSLYLQFLLQTTVIAKEGNNTEKVKQLIDYIQEYCQESSAVFVAANLRYFKYLFYGIAKVSNQKDFFENGGFAIFKIIAQAVLKVWGLVKDNVYLEPYVVEIYFSELVDSFLYVTTLTKIDIFSQEYLSQLKKLIIKVVREDPRVRLHQSLLHRAIKLMKTSPLISVALIEILLLSGANANCKDFFRRTPIMYAVKYAPESIFDDLLELLEEYGGHTDCRDNEGFTAMDHKHWGRCLITPIAPLSLRCLATGVIVDNGIKYEGILPKTMKDFVNIHI